MDVRKTSKSLESDGLPGVQRPKTLTVLGLLVLAAGTFSYLGAYAMTAALVEAEVIRPLAKHPDPRPMWALSTFAGMLIASLLIAGVMRYLSSRQFRRIDRMNEEE
jgi:ABC-type branched-subunit amino acid transport system permease subunit